MADPGFPRVGANPGGGTNLLFGFLVKKCIKMGIMD